MAPLYDLHIHLDDADDPRAFARDLTASGVAGCLACTLSPNGYESMRSALESIPTVRVALGLHPWNIADGGVDETDLEAFEALACTAAYVGEIGLDRTKRGVDAFDRQRAFLRRALRACASYATLYSFHGANAAGALLDLIEAEDLPSRAVCVLHWFNGSSVDLKRARALGCYFSINNRMLATKRGREYVKAIARDRLLLETDGLSVRHGLTTPEAIARDLACALTQIETLRDESLGETIAANSRRLLEL